LSVTDVTVVPSGIPGKTIRVFPVAEDEILTEGFAVPKLA